MYESNQETQVFGITPRILGLAQELQKCLQKSPAADPRSVHIKTTASGDDSANITCSWEENNPNRGRTLKRANLVALDLGEDVVFQVEISTDGTEERVSSQARGLGELASLMQLQPAS